MSRSMEKYFILIDILAIFLLKLVDPTQQNGLSALPVPMSDVSKGPKSSAINNNWSVELSNITSLPPLSKMLADGSSLKGGSSSTNIQDSLFDDDVSSFNLAKASPALIAQENSQQVLKTNSDQLESGGQMIPAVVGAQWRPTFKFLAPVSNFRQHESDKEVTQTFAPTSPTSQQFEDSNFDGNSLSGKPATTDPKFLRLPSVVTFYPLAFINNQAETQTNAWNRRQHLLPNEIAQKAIAIQNALQIMHTPDPRGASLPYRAESGQLLHRHAHAPNNQSSKSYRSGIYLNILPPAKRHGTDIDYLRYLFADRTMGPNLRSFKWKDESSPLVDVPTRSRNSDSINARYSHLAPVSSLLDVWPEKRQQQKNLKLDDGVSGMRAEDSLIERNYYDSSVYHPPAYIGHKSMNTRHGVEKSLITSVLAGVAAALITFLLISNLFLSIPLLAYTLMQLFNGNMMMMMLPNNNPNNNIMPNNNGNGGNGGGNGAQANGKKRKRRDLTHFEHDLRILTAISRLESALEN